MGRALVIAHDHLSAPGLLSAGIEAAGLDIDVCLVVPSERFDAPDVTADFPDPCGYDLILALGAPWSVYDDDRLGRWVRDERHLLRAADAHGVPVLGVCFGAQQLAAAHGGAVAPATRAEIGWQRVESDDAALVEPGPWFEWHYDGWPPPPGARPLARSAASPQAFALRRNLAVQFHPEVDEKILVGWLDNGGAAGARAHGVDPDELVARTVAERAGAERRATRLVVRFLDQVARADA